MWGRTCQLSLSALLCILCCLMLQCPMLTTCQRLPPPSGLEPPGPSCPLINITDLGTTEAPGSAVGLISDFLNGLTAPVQILDFNIVCLSAGGFRDTYSTASVVVQYICEAECPITGEPVVAQFVFRCQFSAWTVETLRTGGGASLMTPIQKDCSMCVDLVDVEFPSNYDPITSCFACVGCRSSPNLCVRGDVVTCCNVYQDNVCSPSCDSMSAEGPNFTCVRPAFRVNGVDIVVSLPIIDTVQYVFDPSKTATPLVITCPYGNASNWTYVLIQPDIDPSQAPPTNFAGTIVLLGARVTVNPPDTLTISSAHMGVVSYSCVSVEKRTISISVFPENPYLRVSPFNNPFPTGTSTFNIRVSAFFTLDGRTSVPAPLSSIEIPSVVDEFNGQLTIQFTQPASGPTESTFSVEVEGVNRADFTVTLTPGGGLSAISRTIQAVVLDIVQVPRVAVLEGSEVYPFRCTPTVESNVTFFLGDIPLDNTASSDSSLLEVSVIPGPYSCMASAVPNVTRTTNVFVVPDNRPITLFDQALIPQSNEHILTPNDFVDTNFTFHCYGRPGHEDLFLTSDHPQLQAFLAEIEVTENEDTENVVLVDQVMYFVSYTRANSRSSINFISLTAMFSEDPPFGFVQRFSCQSRQSTEAQNITMTLMSSLLILPPPTIFNSLFVGENLELTFFFATENEDQGVSYTDSLIFQPNSNSSAMMDFTQRAQITEVSSREILLQMIVGVDSLGMFTFMRSALRSIASSAEFTINSVTIPTLTPSVDSTLSVREGEPFELSCQPSGALVRLQWVLNDSFYEGSSSRLSNDSNIGLTPPLLQHRVSVRNATDTSGGRYSCEVQGSTLLRQVISVRIIRRCVESLSLGVIWPQSFEGSVERTRCSAIDSRFSNFVMATRMCGVEGRWDPVDTTPCTLTSPTTPPFIIIWLSLRDPSQVTLTTQLLTNVTNEISSIVDAFGSVPRFSNSVAVETNSASLTVIPRLIMVSNDGGEREGREGEREIPRPAQPLVYRASLALTSPLTDINVFELMRIFAEGRTEIGGLRFFMSFQDNGVQGFFPSLECSCIFTGGIRILPQGPIIPIGAEVRKRRQGGEGEGGEGSELLPQIGLTPLCAGVSSSPCDCTSTPTIPDPSSQQEERAVSCQCMAPFVGDGVSCTTDSDRDGFPDDALSRCSNDTAARIYCQADTCPTIYNLPQSDTPCMNPVDGDLDLTLYCNLEEDDSFGFLWGFTSAGFSRVQPCGLNFIGNASRECGADGVWMPANVNNCLRLEYQQALASAAFLVDEPYSLDMAEFLLEDANSLSMTTGDGTFTSTAELQATSNFLANSVDFLLEGVDGEELLPSLGQSLPLLDLFSDVVSPDNVESTAQLSATADPDMTFAQDVLNSAEGYGLYLSAVLEQEEGVVDGMTQMTLAADNILLNAVSVNVGEQMQDLTFPPSNLADLMILNSSTAIPSNSNTSILDRIGEASIVLPASLLRQRAALRNTGRVRVANILYQNLEELLPLDSGSIVRKPASIILSSQVEEQRSIIDLTDPITLTFTLGQAAQLYNDSSEFRCNFFDFFTNTFSTEGVDVTSSELSGSDRIVVCQSNHLTSFAVLVNVGGREINSLSLSIVSYVGLGISLVCLLFTIIFFLTLGKKLFTAVHNLVHLNLAIALFLAYLCFAVGIELGARHEISCKFVAALLHYLFLAVFCWMLCEGVMLYLMLWVVFSTLSKKWWFFLLLGWLPPIIFVVIGLATVLDQYGMKDENGKLQFCWLSSGNGNHAIWAFAAPMLAIILINIVFLVLVTISLIRNQLKKNKIKEDSGKRIELVKSIVKASFILLPLLGVTWLFGFLIVSEASIAFAWVFTILNTLQGVAIFILHVLRHERIWGRFKKKYNLFQSTTSKASNSQVGMYKKPLGTNSTTSGGNYYSKGREGSEFKQSLVAEETRFVREKESQVSNVEDGLVEKEERSDEGVNETAAGGGERVKEDYSEVATLDFSTRQDSVVNPSHIALQEKV